MTTKQMPASTLLAATTLPGIANASTEAPDVAAIRNVLIRYEQALNASDTAAVMSLYAADGVFMPAFSPSAVGEAEVHRAYDAVFNAIELDVKFDIAEIAVIAPDWAFARTNSAGSVTIHATGAKGPETNQELFLLHRTSGGDWKIARYSFSPTKPPHR